MKIKKRNIILITILIIWSLSTNVFAANASISLNGDEQVKAGQTKTVTVKVSADKEVGMVSGKIQKEGKITTIEVKAQNDWNLTYNKEKGLFNIYKAEGAKEEEIIAITYTTEEEGTAQIKLSDLNITTIDYKENGHDDITKDIEIVEAGAEGEPDGNPEGEPGEEPEDEPEDEKKPGGLPEAGKNSIILVTVVSIAIVGGILYTKIKKYRNI